jgi:hypothetical protein
MEQIAPTPNPEKVPEHAREMKVFSADLNE